MTTTKKKSILIIQARFGSNKKWLDACTPGESLDEVREEKKEYESNNPNYFYRIIERTTTTTEKEIE